MKGIDTHLRAFVPASQWQARETQLDPEESHHVTRVLRAKPGDKLAVFNGEGGTGAAEITSVGKRVSIRISERSYREPPLPRITLVQAIAREQKMDLVLQKATELGLAELVPVLTANSVVKLDEDRAAGKQERWERIALSALKQSGNLWMPAIRPVQTLNSFLRELPQYDVLLACALSDDSKPVRDVLRSLPPSTSRIAVMVGPEGDFSADELEAMHAAGAIPIDLGDSVLRSETAALYAISILRYEFSKRNT